VKTWAVGCFGLSRVAACVPIGREGLGTALPGTVFFLFGFTSVFVHGVIGLLYAGLCVCEEFENAI
jgi:hypothetical protein